MSSELARRQMVDQQIRTWDVFDPAVLRLLSTMPRDRFVDPRFAHLAYADTEIPIGFGEKMLTPMIEGRLLQSLDISGEDSILEVGTGSGYMTACLARLGASVKSIDIHEEFLELAAQRLKSVGIGNADLSCIDATRELPEGKFDAIAITGSMPRFDERFLEALKPGGRLFVVVGDSPVMEAQLIVAGDDTGHTSSALFETDLKPLVNAVLPSPFRF
jgi:protein-L-isoaspartate(D-aspartate) O-methyltransferase